jgi:hypothetical protein
VNVHTLLAKMASQREAWVDLPGGQRLQYRRPPEVELPRLAGGVTPELVVEYACGWDKFTEADLLGAAVGSSDSVPFAPELWAAYVRDNSEVLQVVAMAMAKTVTDYLLQRQAEAKNSAPSSI